MANSTLTTDILAKASVRYLENFLVAAKHVRRDLEDEFAREVNGFTPGDTISVRKPPDYTVGTSADITGSVQDVVEGKTSITVNQRRNIAINFTSQELTQDIRKVGPRQIAPAMVQLANSVDVALMGLYTKVPNVVGTPGQAINSFADLALIGQRATELGIPAGNRALFMQPASYWGMLSSQTGLLHQGLVGDAYKKGKLPEIGTLMPFETQNAPTHTTGSFAGTTLVDGSITTATTTYTAVKDTNTQSITIDGFTASAPALKKGDVFTIADVYDVNPVTKARLGHLKQFTITADVTGSTNEATVVVSPALIWTGAHKNIDVSSGSDLDNKAVTFVGTQSTVYPTNLMLHKDAFALAMVPLAIPPGSVDGSYATYKGISIRVVPVYNGLTDVSTFRFDVLFGIEAIDPRLAIRGYGSA